jgi:putative membrane protein
MLGLRVGQDSPDGLAGVRPVPFWSEAVAIRGSVSRQIFYRVVVFTAFSLAVCFVDWITPNYINLGVGVAPYEVAGAALALLLVLRVNAGYDRWWEGRKLWGAIVNQSRELATTAVAYGPDDPAWRDSIVRWVAAFAHVTRHTLRGERAMPRVDALLGAAEARRIASARHMPTAGSLEIASLLDEGRERHGMDGFAFGQAELSRCLLIDQVGGCERILKSPLPAVISINIRRCILLFLGTLPFALLYKIRWWTPVVMFLAAYVTLSLDEIGVELQNPFAPRNLGHLPLDDICATIEGDLLAIAGSFPSEKERDTLGSSG